MQSEFQGCANMHLQVTNIVLLYLSCLPVKKNQNISAYLVLRFHILQNGEKELADNVWLMKEFPRIQSLLTYDRIGTWSISKPCVYDRRSDSFISSPKLLLFLFFLHFRWEWGNEDVAWNSL